MRLGAAIFVITAISSALWRTDTWANAASTEERNYLGIQIEAGFVVSESQKASSHMACAVLCQIDPECSMVQFIKVSGLCNKILRDVANEPRQVAFGGVLVHADDRKPGKFNEQIMGGVHISEVHNLVE